MTRRAVVVLMLLITAGVVALAWFVFIPAMPLQGPRGHDFGLILIEGDDGRATTPLTLVNSSNETIVIESVKGTCSCITAWVDQREVEPRGDVTLNISIMMNASGVKRESVRIAVRDHGVFTIDVTARARKAQQLSIAQEDIAPSPGASLTTSLHAELWPADLTAAPTIQAVKGLRVELKEWHEVRAGNEAKHSPAIYAGELTLAANSDIAVGRYDIRCVFGDVHVLTIPIEIKSDVQ